MGLSLSDAVGSLLSGSALSWSKFRDIKGGTVILSTPESRRLFQFLMNADAAKVATAEESLFTGLIAAWDRKQADPVKSQSNEDSEICRSSWCLEKIEAFGFGGLTIFNGKVFELFVGGNNWCLEGQNGSGKTSLVSAILWALTGKRIREHEGPVDDRGVREEVLADNGVKIGSWPPLASYPTEVADLGKSAEVWVRLTFVDEVGNKAAVYRRVVSPPVGNALVEVEIDKQLVSALRLAEIGVLMPARLSKLGFGKNSLTLYESVKELSGLDQLSYIADGAANLGAANRKFMKYAKDNQIELHENRFDDAITTASRLAKDADFELPRSIRLAASDIAATLDIAACRAAAGAGEYLGKLKDEIAPRIDVTMMEGREEIRAAVLSVRGAISQGPKTIPLFQIWKALTDAVSDVGFLNLPAALQIAETELAEALDWDRRQATDSKLRLKAIASQSFIYEPAGDSACPLCTSPLNDARKRALATELEELKVNSAIAERKIKDVCRGLIELLRSRIPDAINESRQAIDKMNPSNSFKEIMGNKFVTDESFSTVLVALVTETRKSLASIASDLPNFTYSSFVPSVAEPDAAIKVRFEIHLLRRLMALVEWWATSRVSFFAAWTKLVGKKQDDGSFPSDSLEGRLEFLEKALGEAGPLDDLSNQLSIAAKAAKNWHAINMVQQKRVAIKTALEPLKELRFLVAAETARSIEGLSQGINSVCARICLRERLEYREAILGRKEVTISGSFNPGMRIDAGLVANTSWIRAILWAFIFALREEVISSLGFNPMPLLVLDDPQTTFDPRNKRKWAHELATNANLGASEPKRTQLFVTTHERNFFQMLVDHEKIHAQQGLIGGVNKISGVATIANGGELERLYGQAVLQNNDALARDYVRKVRIYCEDLLKFMLRSVKPGISDKNFTSLREELKSLNKKHVAPYDRKPFDDLISKISDNQKAIKYINTPPHKDDETFGLAEAEIVKLYWDKYLNDCIYNAFCVCDNFELYTGEPRTFPWAKEHGRFSGGARRKVKGPAFSKKLG